MIGTVIVEIVEIVWNWKWNWNWNDIARDIVRDIVCIAMVVVIVVIVVIEVVVGAMIGAMEIWVVVIVNALEMNDVKVVLVAMEYAMSDCDVID